MLAVIKRYLTILLGSFIVALSLDLFLVPADIAPGGLSGVAIILHHIANIPVGLSILFLNFPLFLWSMRYFSAGFMFSSLFGMVSVSILTDAFAWINPLTGDILLSAVYGGALMGLGLGIVFVSGSTTGGTDIAAQILKKYFPSISVGKFILIIDAFIVALAGLTFGRWEIILYSSVALYICTYIIDLLAEGIDFAKVAYIISDKPKAISSEISARLERGTTALHGTSHYSGADKTVLLCVVKKYEINKLKKLIKEIDKDAFVILSDTREVLGNGFKTN